MKVATNENPVEYILYIESGKRGFIGVKPHFPSKDDAIDFAMEHHYGKDFKLLPVRQKKRADGSIWFDPVLSLINK